MWKNRRRALVKRASAEIDESKKATRKSGFFIATEHTAANKTEIFWGYPVCKIF